MPEGDNKNKSLDIFGIKPIGEAVLKITDASLSAAGAFLGRICLPAAEEFGLLLKDKVIHWRATNAAKIALTAEAKLKEQNMSQIQAHPRLVAEIIDKGSWSDNNEILEKWGGLLASSCSIDGEDDSNLIFITLLNQLTSVQVKILDYACEHSNKYISPSGLPFASNLTVDIEELKNISAISDIHRLDRELDFMRSSGLLASHNAGLGVEKLKATITPSALGLHLYVRAKGFQGSPVDFWSIAEIKR